VESGNDDPATHDESDAEKSRNKVPSPGVDEGARIAKAFGVNGYPTTFLLRPDLAVAFVQLGYEKDSARLKEKLAETGL